MFGRIMVILTLVVLTLTIDLSNLGRDISESVSRSLKPLEGLGSRIDDAVRESLAPLDNLGAGIEQTVYEGLEPVRALEIIGHMKNGIGGVTIVQYQPGGAEFIIRNSKLYKCSGSIDRDSGSCSGSLIPHQTQTEEDYCFLIGNGYSIINNNICIGADFVSVVNNEIICKNNNGRPVLFTTLDDFKKLCQKVAATANYRYIADAGNPQHVKVPSENKHVKCDNNASGICDFHESNNFAVLGGQQRIFIQNFN